MVITDWEKRQWKRILTPEEAELEKAYKALRLNGGVPMYVPNIIGASKKKPTIKIKRFGSGKLQAGSTIQRQLLELEKVKAEKALRLNGG